MNVTNTLCGTSCSTIGGIPIFLTGGASASQVSITGAIRNATLGTLTPSDSRAAVIVVDGASSRVTISGQ